MRDFSVAAAGLWLVAAGVALGALALLLAFWLRRPRVSGPARDLAGLSLAWAGAALSFFTWWDPTNQEFWVAFWVPLAILTALPIAIRPPHIRRRLCAPLVAMLLIALGGANLVGSILPQRVPANDYWRQRVA